MGEARENGMLGSRLREEQLRLPFDQYQRYRMIADVVELLREDSGSLQILDVGGGEGVILNFLPEDRITVLDQTAADELAAFVEGDATALPFDAGAFDYVTSVDAYEQIEPESRERYLSELRRTSRNGVLLAAPFDSEVVRGAEMVANEFHRSVHSNENVWLMKHVENGLPRLDDARRYFEACGDTVSVLPNGYIPHWLAMICLTFYSSKLEGESSTVFDHVNAFYNEFIYKADNTEPCYRHLLVSLKEPVNANLESLTSTTPGAERTSLSSVLFGTFSAMLPMTTELKQLNSQLAKHERQLTQRERALARKEARSNARLAEYKERLAEKEGAVARKEAQINNLTRRLAERVGVMNRSWIQSERSIAKLQQDLNKLQQDHSRLKSQRDQLRQEIAQITGSRAWRLLTLLHKVKLVVGNIFRSG